MPPEVKVALITTGGVVAAALIGLMSAVLVELIKSRKQRGTAADQLGQVVTEMSPNGGASVKDAVTAIRDDVREIRTVQNRQGQQLATLQARFDDHLLERRRA